MATEYQRKAIKKYLDKKEQVRLWVDLGEKDRYKKLADYYGFSLAEFIRKAIEEYVQNHSND